MPTDGTTEPLLQLPKLIGQAIADFGRSRIVDEHRSPADSASDLQAKAPAADCGNRIEALVAEHWEGKPLARAMHSHIIVERVLQVVIIQATVISLAA